MVKPNYDFAKRQREIAKKAKKEEKLRKKAAGQADGDTEENLDETAGEGEPDSANASDTPATP